MLLVRGGPGSQKELQKTEQGSPTSISWPMNLVSDRLPVSASTLRIEATTNNLRKKVATQSSTDPLKYVQCGPDESHAVDPAALCTYIAHNWIDLSFELTTYVH